MPPHGSALTGGPQGVGITAAKTWLLENPPAARAGSTSGEHCATEGPQTSFFAKRKAFVKRFTQLCKNATVSKDFHKVEAGIKRGR